MFLQGRLLYLLLAPIDKGCPDSAGVPRGKTRFHWATPFCSDLMFYPRPDVIISPFAKTQPVPTIMGRSRPVSCRFCRSRKLRCSRKFPCANCTSRGISCQLEGSSTVSVSSADEAPNTSSGTFQEDVLARLRRLENIVIGQSQHSQTPPDQVGSRPGPPRPRRKGDLIASFTKRSSTVDVDWLESQIAYPGSSVGLCIAEYGKR